MFPQFDLGVSHLFGDHTGFAMSRNPVWVDVRHAFIASTDGLVAALAILLVVNLLRQSPLLLTCRQISFALMAYALGPGLIVNGIFKSWWGRARPRDVLEFGGRHLFTPPLVPATECSHNCSFVSGEGSAVMAIALIVILLLWPRLSGKGRLAMLICAAVYVAFGGGLRVAFGGHFFSDVVFAALMMAVVVPATYLVIIGPGTGPADRTKSSGSKILTGRASP
ncbi:MAG: phosphatase PAP2 family protein [Paracoccus sp. (in: a-proteobacteria)]|nr:phosphatase PAP2 family protein [Paracoccus sp. (in: a-proteobacteria)]